MNTSRISMVNGGFMFLSAVFVDFIQFLLTLIPFIGWLMSSVISVIAAMIFGVWLSHNDISIMSPERSLQSLGTMLGEFTPGINATPIWTGSITYTIIREWTAPAKI